MNPLRPPKKRAKILAPPLGMVSIKLAQCHALLLTCTPLCVLHSACTATIPFPLIIPVKKPVHAAHGTKIRNDNRIN